MAYSAPMTAVATASFTAAQFNQYVRDNLLETAPAKSTGANQIFVSTGVNAIAARTPTIASVITGVETTTSTTYTSALTTPGPAVTVTTGGKAIIMIAAICRCGTAAIGAHASYAVSGASTIAADDAFGTSFMGGSANSSSRVGTSSMQNLTPGSNTFTMAYRSGGAATAGFDARSIIVIPL